MSTVRTCGEVKNCLTMFTLNYGHFMCLCNASLICSRSWWRDNTVLRESLVQRTQCATRPLKANYVLFPVILIIFPIAFHLWECQSKWFVVQVNQFLKMPRLPSGLCHINVCVLRTAGNSVGSACWLVKSGRLRLPGFQLQAQLKRSRLIRAVFWSFNEISLKSLFCKRLQWKRPMDITIRKLLLPAKEETLSWTRLVWGAPSPYDPTN